MKYPFDTDTLSVWQWDTMPDAARVEERAPKPQSVASGSGYRAIITDDGHVVWSCSHVHFTEHSARVCAEQHLRLGPPR